MQLWAWLALEIHLYSLIFLSSAFHWVRIPGRQILLSEKWDACKQLYAQTLFSLISTQKRCSHPVPNTNFEKAPSLYLTGYNWIVFYFTMNLSVYGEEICWLAQALSSTSLSQICMKWQLGRVISQEYSGYPAHPAWISLRLTGKAKKGKKEGTHSFQ